MRGLLIYLENMRDLEKLKECEIKIPKVTTAEIRAFLKDKIISNSAQLFEIFIKKEKKRYATKIETQLLATPKMLRDNLIWYCPQCSGMLTSVKENENVFVKECRGCGCKVIYKQLSRRKYRIETIHAKDYVKAQ